MPDDPIPEQEWQDLLDTLGSDLRENNLVTGAGELKAMFEGFVQGGFTEDQALRIIAYGLFHQPKGPDL